jgi:hypothetical protein
MIPAGIAAHAEEMAAMEQKHCRERHDPNERRRFGEQVATEWRHEDVPTSERQRLRGSANGFTLWSGVYLKISTSMLDIFSAIRERCALIMREGAAAPETS